MFVDARSVPPGTVIETEVCIVGAGAAGITLAREFINSGFRVALLESGDFDFQDKTQDLYGGANIGRRYFDPKDVGLRLRYFGGTTNHWGGWCAPLDPLDFEEREGVPHSGWPFSRDYLEPWYRRAQMVLQLGPYGYAPGDWGITPKRYSAAIQWASLCMPGTAGKHARPVRPRLWARAGAGAPHYGLSECECPALRNGREQQDSTDSRRRGATRSSSERTRARVRTCHRRH